MVITKTTITVTICKILKLLFIIFFKLIDFKSNIEHIGFAESREDYEKVLLSSDLLISTADHEFFGIAVLEAISAGVYPLLPERLSYPEILSVQNNSDNNRFLYDGSIDDFTEKIIEISLIKTEKGSLASLTDEIKKSTSRFNLDLLAPRYDIELQKIIKK